MVTCSYLVILTLGDTLISSIGATRVQLPQLPVWQLCAKFQRSPFPTYIIIILCIYRTLQPSFTKLSLFLCSCKILVTHVLRCIVLNRPVYLDNRGKVFVSIVYLCLNSIGYLKPTVSKQSP